MAAIMSSPNGSKRKFNGAVKLPARQSVTFAGTKKPAASADTQIAKLKKILASQPSMPEWERLHTQAAIQALQGQKNEAEQLLLQATRLPDCGKEAFKTLAALYLQMGKHRLAIIHA